MKAPWLAAIFDAVPGVKQVVANFLDATLENQRAGMAQYLDTTPQIQEELKRKGDDPTALQQKLDTLGSGCQR